MLSHDQLHHFTHIVSETFCSSSGCIVAVLVFTNSFFGTRPAVADGVPAASCAGLAACARECDGHDHPPDRYIHRLLLPHRSPERGIEHLGFSACHTGPQDEARNSDVRNSGSPTTESARNRFWSIFSMVLCHSSPGMHHQRRGNFAKGAPLFFMYRADCLKTCGVAATWLQLLSGHRSGDAAISILVWTSCCKLFVIQSACRAEKSCVCISTSHNAQIEQRQQKQQQQQWQKYMIL